MLVAQAFCKVGKCVVKGEQAGIVAETEAEKYVEAEACYNETWDLSFVSDSMEILRQNRLGAIEDLRNHQKDLYADAMGAMAARDTVADRKSTRLNSSH